MSRYLESGRKCGEKIRGTHDSALKSAFFIARSSLYTTPDSLEAARTPLWTPSQILTPIAIRRNRVRPAGMDAIAGASRSKSLATLGFLSIIERPPHGIVGGYLLVTSQGRPLEFHCSAPIVPNRAQEILYGLTLRPFLYGELIGKSLVEHAKLQPDAVLIDSPETLSMRDMVDLPLAFVTSLSETANPRHGISFGQFHLTTAQGADADQAVLQRLAPIAGNLDLCEPFERIRNAIEEAQQMAA